MTEIYETQSERTDLPLVVMPSVLDSMIEPIKAQFPALHDVARVRMFEEFTSDEATIAERLKDADACWWAATTFRTICCAPSAGRGTSSASCSAVPASPATSISIRRAS